MFEEDPKKVKCLKCERTPLETTAKANNGLCGVCFREFEFEQLQLSRQKYVDNPPRSLEEINKIASGDDVESLGLKTFLHSIRPPFFDPRVFSKAVFLETLRDIIVKYKYRPDDLSMEFLHLCEPIYESSVTTKKGFMSIPSPIREIYALNCAWGAIGSDGFNCYISSYDRWFDKECDKAIDILNTSQPKGVLRSVRKYGWWILGSFVPESVEEKLWKKWYEPIQNFEKEFLCPYLIAHYENI